MLTLSGGKNVADEDIFGVAYGAGHSESLEELRAFSWPEIVDQIFSGEYTPKICWVMSTQEIPSEFNEDELKQKHIENYQNHVRSILQDLADQQT